MFRLKKSVPVSYERQGYIYFTSRCFLTLTEREKKKIIDLCAECGGENSDALLQFVTTDTGATAICIRHHISANTLYRAVRKYYERFPKKL
jgi:hypothetical protein